MRATLGLVLLTTVATCCHADPVDDLVEKVLKEQRVPGMTISILRDGKPVKQRAYGMANVELGVPARLNTRYELASVSKQFTAVTVLSLVDEGKLSLDAPVSQWVTDAPSTWQGITVRHLLNHTSGLPEFHFRPDRVSALSFMRYTVDMQIEDIRRSRLLFRPGQRFGYSNAGYELLAIIAQRVSGKPFEQLRKERVLDPAGMSETVAKSDATIIPNRSGGYTLRNGVLVNWTLSQTLQSVDCDGFGGLLSTVGDLAKWEDALAAGKILKPETWKQAWTPTTLADGKVSNYGFGWSVQESPNGKIISHTGHTGTFLIRLPDKKLTIICLSNLGIGNPPPYGNDQGWRLNEFANRLSQAAIAMTKSRGAQILTGSGHLGRF